MNQYKYIMEIDEEAFEKSIVIPCINENGFKTVIIKNKTEGIFFSEYSTKYLIAKKNVILTRNDKSFFCHLITCRENNEITNHNFNVFYDYLFKKLESPIDEYELMDILYSIGQLFSVDSKETARLQIGVCGELLTLFTFYQNGYESVLNYYHKQIYSRHDIELSSTKKIEIKTTTKEQRLHQFKHGQLVNPTFEIYVSSVKLMLSEKGMNLNELFDLVIKCCSNYETIFTLNVIRNRCGVTQESPGIVFSFEPSLSSVIFLKGSDIPQIKENIPDGIINLYYESLCDFAIPISIHDLMNN